MKAVIIVNNSMFIQAKYTMIYFQDGTQKKYNTIVEKFQE